MSIFHIQSSHAGPGCYKNKPEADLSLLQNGAKNTSIWSELDIIKTTNNQSLFRQHSTKVIFQHFRHCKQSCNICTGSEASTQKTVTIFIPFHFIVGCH